jgi:hypothetical protein
MTTSIITTSPRRITYSRIRNVCFLILIITFSIFKPSRLSSHSLADSIFGEYTSTLESFVLVPIGLIGIICHIFSRRKKIIGTLTMEEEIISIKLSNEISNFNIKEIKDLKIEQQFSDLPKEAVTLMSTFENWLTFENENIKYKYQFRVETSYSSIQLEKLITFWKMNKYIE